VSEIQPKRLSVNADLRSREESSRNLSAKYEL
jgi:hypothetical protein